MVGDKQIIKHLMDENRALRKIIENLTQPTVRPLPLVEYPFSEDKKDVAEFVKTWDGEIK